MERGDDDRTKVVPKSAKVFPRTKKKKKKEDPTQPTFLATSDTTGLGSRQSGSPALMASCPSSAALSSALHCDRLAAALDPRPDAADSLLDLCCCRLEDGGRLAAMMRLLSQMMDWVVGLSRTWLTSAAPTAAATAAAAEGGSCCCCCCCCRCCHCCARRRRSRTSHIMQPESNRSTFRESNRSKSEEGNSCWGVK